MTNVYSTLPRLAVKDSFDDDDLTDIDDEVFIRDGKSGGVLKVNDDGGVKRPLMAPRRKSKISNHYESRSVPFKALIIPVCYGAMALVVLLGLVLLCIVTINVFPVPLNILKNLLPGNTQTEPNSTEILSCTSLASNVLWTRTLPKLTSEAPLRNIDVNGDGVDDILIGFSTGPDAFGVSAIICEHYFDGQMPCLGGVMALNGKTGETLWTHWTNHAIFTIDCALDITNDKINDCVITGRGGILHAIDGHMGYSIWKFADEHVPLIEQEIYLDVYDARFITDIDHDGIGDVVAVISHTSQVGRLRSSEMVIISGKTGIIIKTINISKNEQLFIAPQTLVHPDGEVMYLLASSTPELAGGLYILPHADLMMDNMELRTLQHGVGKGILVSPILVDITADGTEDIIVSSLDSTIVAYNGLNFNVIWNYTVPDAEVISVPIPGYYNDDAIPDFIIKYLENPSSTTHSSSLLTILDGKTGNSLLENPLKQLGGGEMSGLTLSVEGLGNDWFIYWAAECLEQEKPEEKHHFSKGELLLSQSRANSCKFRENATLSTRLLAISQHVGPPGQSIYFSEDWKLTEFNGTNKDRKYQENYLNKAALNFEASNPILNGPVLSQSSDSDPRLNSRPDPENIQVLDEQADYFLKNNNEKKAAEVYSAPLYIPEPKVSNERFPYELDWNNANSWDNLEKQYDAQFNEPNDDLEAGQRVNKRQHLNKLHYSARKRRNSDHFDQVQGVPRQPPVGLILPSLSQDPQEPASDLIFSTYWLPPLETALVLLRQDRECIRLKEAKIMRRIDAIERETMIAECLAERGINYQFYKEGFDRESIKSSFGQMTVYRMKLRCGCPDDMLPGQACKNISTQQSWPSRLGRMGDGYFRFYSKPKS